MKPTPKSAPTPAPQPQAPPTPPTSGGNGQGDGGSETFLVESITAQVSPNGNRYYAIRGGRVKKHGASAWPEVAEPQLLTLLEYDIKNLEVGKPWEVVEWNIQAVGEIEAGKKYPNKVTAFAPAVDG